MLQKINREFSAVKEKDTLSKEKSFDFIKYSTKIDSNKTATVLSKVRPFYVRIYVNKRKKVKP